MREFKIEEDSYLDRDIKGYYNCEYVGCQKENNPDFINHLKNMSNSKSEMELVEDFIKASEILTKDIQKIVDKEKVKTAICLVPRSKAERHYKQSQLMFKKAVSCVADKLNLENLTDAIIRIKDTKTTHNWRLENNRGESSYKGITKDTCEIKRNKITDKDILLIDDIYTEGVNVIEDVANLLLELGAKSVRIYVIAKTRS